MKNFLYFAFSFLSLSLSTSALAKIADCCAGTASGEKCLIHIVEAHPTQFSVGMVEVEAKREKIEAMGEEKLSKFLKKHSVPAVIGPQHRFFITDHHHLARALLEAGVDEMILDIQQDWGGLPEDQFWARMKSSQFVYLYDENGQGPLPPSQLPEDVNHLADDAYRGLAWAVQKRTAAYDDTNFPYASFLWANFFRARVSKDLVYSSFDNAVELGAKLAKSPEARNLPGYSNE